MNRHIDQIEFTIFDTETTGLSALSGDRIIEIAAVRFKGSRIISTFDSLVNPGRPVSPMAFAVNRISDGMLESAPDMAKVLPGFLRFIKGSCLCSYNAPFDWGFLVQELKLAGMPGLEDIAVVDILKMARRLLPGLERYPLWNVAQKVGLEIKQEHRALSDVMLTYEAFHKLKEILLQKEIIEYGNFISLFGISCVFLQDIYNQRIAMIQKAIDSGVDLKIKYISTATAKVSQRQIAPRKIKTENNRCYLVGLCSLKKEERSFRIDGILDIEVL